MQARSKQAEVSQVHRVAIQPTVLLVDVDEITPAADSFSSDLR
jgi:hypothetical protein